MVSGKEKLAVAVQFLNAGNIESGKSLLIELTLDAKVAEQALTLLFKIAMKQNNINQAKYYCLQLINSCSSKFDYVYTLVQLYLSDNEYNLAISALESYLALFPNHDRARLELGVLAKKANHKELAKKHLLAVTNSSLENKYTALTELATVYSELYQDHKSAVNCLKEVIEAEPSNIQAHFNLANIFEQQGAKQKAKFAFYSVLSIDPKHSLALARLADLDTFDEVSALAYEQRSLELLKKETNDVLCADLHYALGKVFNDIKNYSKAWGYYTKANSFNQKYLPKYDRNAIDQVTEHTLNRSHCMHQAPASEQLTPIIICGMFRSGSTLIEQILNSCCDVSAGGEITYLHSQLFNLVGSKNDFLHKVKSCEFSKGYHSELALRAKNTSLVTDKRPENYLYIDVIKSLYPNAKIIWTERDIRDNSLSAYFQHLGPNLNYATDLNDTIHHYEHQQIIKKHWQRYFDKDIFTLEYDQLVVSPTATLQTLFNFLGLAYQGEADTFHQQKNYVSTASVWQVRKPLYNTSSGRYLNYLPFIVECIENGEYKDLLKS
ncbi:tetratricopeptide repeat-containing sulfotransferase family protein [Pseudoalteromonas rhizosphaerae]|uniref:tetratricopeptide repeat-containing sulfotransferase family protein n=1 Tax=Pseudoalteromonas rhizosphaerae TaxID=2518973 RepID=UPI001230C432|nr:tetratricopeptide repeat-containing sulfotransferase family protein [Pseudoalteromonas rhizosphaerae]